MTLDFLLKLLGVFSGVLARTLIPFLRKLREGKIERFSKRYLISAIASLILGFIITLVIFPQFDANTSGSDFESHFKLFCLAFGFGFGWNAIVLEGRQWANAFKKNSSRGENHDRK